MKLRELDKWYADNELQLEEPFRLRNIAWQELTYERKHELYTLQAQQASRAMARDDSAARAYHRRPEVIAYFKRNKLIHESGDYRQAITG